MWDANLNLGYRWTETFSTTFGYRYLDVDYEDGTFLYDVSQDGLTLGLSWRF
jgi:opacity protein-like surface antigen